MCWPQNPPGHQAKVDCLNNVAFAQALKQSSGSENIGEMKQNIDTVRGSGYHGEHEKSKRVTNFGSAPFIISIDLGFGQQRVF